MGSPYPGLDLRIKTGKSSKEDGEHEAGQRILQYIHTNKIINVGVVITQWINGIQLGPDYGGTHKILKIKEANLLNKKLNN